MEYFISRDDQVRGPFSKQQVLVAIKNKKLRKTDCLGTSANGPWQTVEKAIGSKGTKASNPSPPVQSEPQDDVGNSFAGEMDFGSLAGIPAVSSFPMHFAFVQDQAVARHNSADSPTSNSHLANAAKELKRREAAEEAEESNQKKTFYIVAASCLLGVAVLLPLAWVAGTGFWNAIYGNTASQQTGSGGGKKINLRVNKANFLKIQKGMSSAQLKVLLGKPDEVKDLELLDTYVYEWKSGEKQIIVWINADGIDVIEQKGLD